MLTRTRILHNWLLRSRPFLLYPLLIAGLAGWIVRTGRPAVLESLLMAGSGLLAWTFIEWVFHRAMHLQVRSPLLIRFQDDAHLRHHRVPDDLEHSVLRLRGSIPLAVAFFAIAWLISGSIERAAAFMIGLLLGYLTYEFVHLASHARRKMRWMRPLIAYHSRHHYQDNHLTFGVTSPLWDWVFGTLPAPCNDRSAAVSKTMSAHRSQRPLST